MTTLGDDGLRFLLHIDGISRNQNRAGGLDRQLHGDGLAGRNTAQNAARLIADKAVRLQAVAVAAAFVFGDHLGFTAGNEPEMIFPVIVGKLTAGITAVILANVLAPKLLSKIENTKM